MHVFLVLAGTYTTTVICVVRAQTMQRYYNVPSILDRQNGSRCCSVTQWSKNNQLTSLVQPVKHNSLYNRPVSHSARHQRPARERHIMRIASRENVDNKRRAIQILHNNTFQFTFKCGYNDFISKYTDINSLHVTQIDLLHNDTFCST